MDTKPKFEIGDVVALESHLCQPATISNRFVDYDTGRIAYGITRGFGEVAVVPEGVLTKVQPR